MSAPLAGMSSPRSCAEPITTIVFCSWLSSDASSVMTFIEVTASVYGSWKECIVRCVLAEMRWMVYCDTCGRREMSILCVSQTRLIE